VYIFIFVLMLMSSQDPSPRIDGDQFLNIIRGLHAEIRDFSFIYEGERKLVRMDATESEQQRVHNRYQGTYAFRSDGSTHLDVYFNGSGGGLPLFRSMAAILGDKTELLKFAPDSSTRRVVKERKRNPYLLERNSPRQFLFHWYFEAISDANSYDYEFQGWENIDGRNCIRVKLGRSLRSQVSKPVTMPRVKPVYVMWIDLERSGNPVRIDLLGSTSKVTERTRVELQQFTLPNGKKVWFPISGVTETFLTAPNKYSDEPQLRETYFVVRRTLRFNQGLPDSIFTVKRDGQVAGSGELVLRNEFKEARNHRPPISRNDPESVKDMLEKKLVEADRQSSSLEASSVSRESWSWTSLAQFGFVGTGLAFLVAALYWRHSSR
jgi:hypothetical protein